MKSIIQKSKLAATNWGGGETSEILIYPSDSKYSTRDFAFRISTATIETETSDFTQLPGINRQLMLLEGKLELSHDQHHNTILTPYVYDKFEGDWLTQSRGKARVLNLMLMQNTRGRFEVIRIKRGDELKLKKEGDVQCFYMASGSIVFDFGKVEKGELLLIENEYGEIIGQPVDDLVLVAIFIDF